jgi:hypothetical protein
VGEGIEPKASQDGETRKPASVRRFLTLVGPLWSSVWQRCDRWEMSEGSDLAHSSPRRWARGSRRARGGSRLKVSSDDGDEDSMPRWPVRRVGSLPLESDGQRHGQRGRSLAPPSSSLRPRPHRAPLPGRGGSRGIYGHRAPRRGERHLSLDSTTPNSSFISSREAPATEPPERGAASPRQKRRC